MLPLTLRVYGAGEEARTLDIFLGKEVLYQLSYTRMVVRLAGLEPARTRREILSLLRLPITPQSHYLVDAV